MTGNLNKVTLMIVLLFLGCYNYQEKKINSDMKSYKCWETVNINIPEDAILYYAKISPSEVNSMANEQWILKSNGSVFYLQNKQLVNYGNEPFNVFNSAFPKQALIVLSEKNINLLKNALAEIGIPTKQTLIKTQKNISIKDGYSLFLLTNFDKKKYCLELEPGVELSQQIHNIFMQSIENQLSQN